MIKELILAILLGAILGFGATGGYYAYKNSQTKNTHLNAVPTSIPSPIDQTQDIIQDTPSTNLSPTEIPVKTTSSTSTLTITSPDNEALVNTTTSIIKGTSQPNSLIVIQTPKKSFTLTANSEGEFSQSIELESGANLIQISAFDKDDNQTDAEILITYSSAKI